MSELIEEGHQLANVGIFRRIRMIRIGRVDRNCRDGCHERPNCRRPVSQQEGKTGREAIGVVGSP
jgi:hypothetical protein